MRLTASVRDKEYQPAADAKVAAHVIGPEGLSAMVDMAPARRCAGELRGGLDGGEERGLSGGGDGGARWDGCGAELGQGRGRDVVAFQRTDGVAENFHTEQNREMLEKLSAETGGTYWKPEELSNLPKEISYSEAGISVRDTKELWNMPAVFLLLLALMAAEWLLRRKWGVV